MPTYIEIAKQFGHLIAQRDYKAAHALLTPDAQAGNTPDDFEQSVENMTSYDPGPIREVIVMEDFILEDWPEKKVGDVAIVYVFLNGEGFCEAVTLTIVQHGNDYLIRHLEWGRP